jgi:IS30 family transposase
MKNKAKESDLLQAAIELLENWKPYLFTITSDNGKEFAMHQEIATVLEVDSILQILQSVATWSK